jgi:hypothetical protein
METQNATNASARRRRRLLTLLIALSLPPVLDPRNHVEEDRQDEKADD